MCSSYCSVLFVSLFLGLSTALANAKDLADWLGIEGQTGLYNFRPSVRPVPLEVHISGYPGKHYCPRMISMNKPAFQAIQQHSPNKPTLIFVSSRRQTRLTALDLIALSGNIFIQVILFEVDCAIFYANLHELFCQFIS